MRPLQPSEFRLDPCGKYASDIEGVGKPPLSLEIQAIRRAIWNGGRWLGVSEKIRLSAIQYRALLRHTLAISAWIP